jgi:DNA-binding PadR family transcriptional regulator
VGAGTAKKRDEAPMRSLVNWALLGLIIDRPSYAYELAQRFERTYDGALTLSSVSHVYVALGTLKERGLVEEVAGTRSGRQPKPHYRATDIGLDSYRDWLVEQLSEDRQRQKLFVLQLAALIRNPDMALEVIDRVEATCLTEASRTPIGAGPAGEGSGTSPMVSRLVGEESRLAVGAKLAWVQYAREELRAHTASRNGKG